MADALDAPQADPVHARDHPAYSRGSWSDREGTSPDTSVPLPPEKPPYRDATPVENIVHGLFGGKNDARGIVKNDYGQPYKTRGQ